MKFNVKNVNPMYTTELEILFLFSSFDAESRVDFEMMDL